MRIRSARSESHVSGYHSIVSVVMGEYVVAVSYSVVMFSLTFFSTNTNPEYVKFSLMTLKA